LPSCNVIWHAYSAHVRYPCFASADCVSAVGPTQQVCPAPAQYQCLYLCVLYVNSLPLLLLLCCSQQAWHSRLTVNCWRLRCRITARHSQLRCSSAQQRHSQQQHGARQRGC
jgi:hypothetical protein